MIEHIWTFLCRGSAVDRDSNSLSIFDIVEQFSLVPVDQQPHPQMIPLFFELVSVWARQNPAEPCREFARVELSQPDNTTLPITEYEVDLMEFERSRIRGRLPGFPTNMPGRYFVQVSRRPTEDDPWEVVARVPLTIVPPQA
ncbi:MAG TPA: hypothetical protein VNH11_16870 [Pirellulales bacterium]|nr:hypothetical protein [Pirellulales bacterium]